MIKSYLLFILMAVAGLSSTAVSAVTNGDLDNNDVSDAYVRLIQAEHQLLKTELAVEAKKSANFESLLADGHASPLENRQQRLVADILKAHLAEYDKFQSQAIATLTDAKIELKSDVGSVKTDSIETRTSAIQELQQELTTLRQEEAKLAHGIVTLSPNDPWVDGYRTRQLVTGQQANVTAAKIQLLQRLNALQAQANQASKVASATDQGSVSTAAWKRPSKDSSSMKLMITQAELQIQLSQHHLMNDTRRLADLQQLMAQGMAEQQSVTETMKRVDAVKELLQQQQDNLSWLKKDLDDSQDTKSMQVSTVSSKNAFADDSILSQTNSPVLQSVLNQFELGQANYLKREAMLKNQMYRETLGVLQQVVAVQQSQSSAANYLISGQQRELEQYRWKIKKTDLQRDLADAEIALLEQSGGSQLDSKNMLISSRVSSFSPVTLPSRFLSSDPFGLQTTYTAFAFNSPAYRARRSSSLATGSGLSFVFRPVINRNALSLYRDLQSFRGFNRFNSFGSFNSGFRSFPGSGLNFGRSPFSNSFNFNSFGRSSRFSAASGFGRIGGF